jgi:hypothetical protein
MNDKQLQFMMESLKRFCLDRSVFIMKDFQNIPTISHRDNFVRRTALEFDNQSKFFIEKCPFELEIHLDNIDNITKFIPSVCITMVGKSAFLVYDIFSNVFFHYMNGHIFIKNLQICPAEHKYKPQSLLSQSAQICYYLSGFSERPHIDTDHPLYKFIQQLEYKPSNISASNNLDNVE